MTPNMDYLALLDDLAVLRIDGDDAVAFLHAQLSNDIGGMGPDDARLAAYCNPKGRMLGSLILWRENGEPGQPLLALVKADLVEPLLKRLRMFVLRAKVSLEITPRPIFGLSMASQPAVLAAGAGTPNTAASGEPIAGPAWSAESAAWTVNRDTAYTRISAPSGPDGRSRSWLVAAGNTDPAALPDELDLPLLGRETWYEEDIQAGLGWVEQANVELFIPQSLNYDLIGGVSFTKGCYPGQEIVARAHFRGAVKRRGIPGQCRLPAGTRLQAGMDVFDAQRPGSPAGRIINAACADRTTDGENSVWQIFMEATLSDIGHADLRALSADGPAISLHALPYVLEMKE